MSQQLISRSDDLSRLRDEGFDVAVVGPFALLRGVPYVNAAREVKRGTLVSSLCLAGDVTTTPDTHVAYFIGEYPCDRNGRPLEQMRHSSGVQRLHADVVVDHSFSSKPPAGYKNYYDKLSTYAAIIGNPARAIDPSATAQTYAPIASSAGDSVFHYADTASSRAKISDINQKLATPRVAVIGLGGTGAYVLDLLAKTPIQELHLFDSDPFLQHNAFRCPGAASLEDLRSAPTKVEYLRQQYSRLRTGIFAHATHVTSANVDVLKSMNFVFLCIDQSSAKRVIVDVLVESSIPFIDVGMGILRVQDTLSGILRVTTGTPAKSDHVTNGKTISFGNVVGNDEYSRNIQVADLNALNAALAVIKWKKLCGFYLDLDREHHSLYTLDGNDLQNAERA